MQVRIPNIGRIQTLSAIQATKIAIGTAKSFILLPELSEELNGYGRQVVRHQLSFGTIVPNESTDGTLVLSFGSFQLAAIIWLKALVSSASDATPDDLPTITPL